jgi:hypothetical protein
MGTLGPNSGGTFATDSLLGVVDWTGASNASISDGSYATSGLLLGQISRYLKVTNFGFTIPLDATITGVTVNVERSTTTLNATHDNSVRLVKNGDVSGDNKATVTQWPTSDAITSYGSSTDLWGLSLTPADINSSDFGVVISAVADLLGTAQIDHVTITIDYVGSNRGGNYGRYVKVGDGYGRNERAS